MFGAADHELDVLALLDDAVHDADQDDDAQIGVVPAVDQHRFQRRVAIPLGRGNLRDDRFQYVVDADARLGAGEHRFGCVEADHLLDLRLHLFRFGRRQVDLVDDRHDFMIMLDRLIDIGERLRLHALGGIHHQQRAFASGEAARHFIGEVDMARRVHQVELVGAPILGDIVEPHRLRLDGDAALFLDVHIIEDLRAHFAVGEATGALDQPIGQGRFAMVDMRDDREVTDLGQVGHRRPIAAILRAVSTASHGRRAL